MQLALFALKESLVGLALGYITNLFFYAVEIAGNFADFQVGFSMSAVFDPALGFQVENQKQEKRYCNSHEYCL